VMLNQELGIFGQARPCSWGAIIVDKVTASMF
jgi:hypothetical protein